MTPRAPLLTAEMADHAVEAWRNEIGDANEAGEGQAALQALADGRTACVRVMSEDECRAEFEAHFKAGGYQYSDSNKANAFGWWLASRRAMGAVR